MLKKLLSLLLFIIITLNIVSFIGETQLREQTELRIEPSSFVINSGESIVLTVTLTSRGQPLPGKTLYFLATIGQINTTSAVTDSNGRVRIKYTAPSVPIEITVDITAEFRGDLRYAPSSATARGTIKPIHTTVKVTGASFPIPDTLKDDVESFRRSIPTDVLKMLPIEIPKEAFILANDKSLYLVFAQQIDKGLATVEGWILPLNVTLIGLSINVIVAKSVTFERTGILTTIREIISNPDNYRFKLVQIRSLRRQVSILYDPDDQSNIEFPLTIGYVTEDNVKPLNIIRKGLDRVREYVFDINKDIIKKLLEADGLRILWVFNFEYEYWYEAEAVTNAIVIPVNHPLLDLLERSLPKLGELLKIDKTIILYDVNTAILFENVRSVTDLKTNSNRYINKVVKITVNSLAGYISVQETLKKFAGCDANKVYVPNIGCVPIYLDVRLEGLISWNELSVPPKREELLIVTGISSLHQDISFTSESGVFEIIGKVVSTREISNSLPEGIALIIHSIKRIGRIDYQRIAKQCRDEIEMKIGELYWVLLDFYPYQRKPDIPFKVPTMVYKPRSPIYVNLSNDIPEIYVEVNFTLVIAIVTPETPINISIRNSDISNIYIKVNERVENIVINFEKLFEKPSNIPNPPWLIYAYYKISTNISKESIEKTIITFSIPKEWILKQNIEVTNVVLLRYATDKWEKLPTRLIGENNTHYIFLAESLGFSYFAISAVAEAAKEIVPTTLLFIIAPIVIIIGVVVATLLIIKKRKK